MILSQKKLKPDIAVRTLLLGVSLSILSACTNTEQVTQAEDTSIGSLANPLIVDPTKNACFDSATTPAIIETVTEQIMLKSLSIRGDSTVVPPAAFHTVTRQKIMRERREVEFEIPCRAIMTPQLIASVQRALIARGYYNGAINGVVDQYTSSAIERFQTAQGYVHTSTLTLQTARALGLVAQPRETF
ncbi:MAG: peptidoglycan-binding domain-containing protein [Octadecabacter sp.]|nr:peptidoglycan-binding domain-containing protein [Octadecabacter sp.]